jgi:hypothetical protein
MHHSDLQTDAELLKEFSGSGSHSAFAALVERHGPMVHAVAMRILSNHHDAQDVTQAAPWPKAIGGRLAPHGVPAFVAGCPQVEGKPPAPGGSRHE